MDGWASFLRCLLGLLSAGAAVAAARGDGRAPSSPPSPAAGAVAGASPGGSPPSPPSPALTVRIPGVVRSLHAGDRLPRGVKRASLPGAVGALTPLVGVPAGGAAGTSTIRTLFIAVRAALGPEAPTDTWATLSSAASALPLAPLAEAMAVAAVGLPPVLVPPAGAVAAVGELPAAAASSTLAAATGANAAAGVDLTVRLRGVVRDALGAGLPPPPPLPALWLLPTRARPPVPLSWRW